MTSTQGPTQTRDPSDPLTAARERVGDMASTAREQLGAYADQTREAGASTLQGVADATHAAAERLERTSPEMARIAREAASAVDRFSDTLRTRSLGEMLQTVDDFARREPMAFFGMTLLAGFAVSRFLTTSAPTRHDRGGTDHGVRSGDEDDGERGLGGSRHGVRRPYPESREGTAAAGGATPLGAGLGAPAGGSEFGRHVASGGTETAPGGHRPTPSTAPAAGHGPGPAAHPAPATPLAREPREGEGPAPAGLKH